MAHTEKCTFQKIYFATLSDADTFRSWPMDECCTVQPYWCISIPLLSPEFRLSPNSVFAARYYMHKTYLSSKLQKYILWLLFKLISNSMPLTVKLYCSLSLILRCVQLWHPKYWLNVIPLNYQGRQGKCICLAPLNNAVQSVLHQTNRV